MPLHIRIVSSYHVIPECSVALKDGATKAAYRKTFLKAQNTFFSSLYSNLMMNVIFPFF